MRGFSQSFYAEHIVFPLEGPELAKNMNTYKKYWALMELVDLSIALMFIGISAPLIGSTIALEKRKDPHWPFKSSSITIKGSFIAAQHFLGLPMIS